VTIIIQELSDKKTATATTATEQTAGPAEPIVTTSAEPTIESASAEHSEGGSATKAPAGGVDQDLWDVLRALPGMAPGTVAAVSDQLAENSVFSVEDAVATPNDRLRAFGVDPASRRAIGRCPPTPFFLLLTV
jgi:hypothetical protein